MDDESIVIKPAEVKTSSGHRRVLLTREVIELAQHGRSGGVECAAKWRAICLVGMTREDPDDPILVARHDRFQRSQIAEDERWVVVGRARQATGMVEHDQIPSRGRRLQLVLQPRELRRAQRPTWITRNQRLVRRFYFDDSLLATRSVNAFLAGRTARAQRAAEERAEP